MSVAAPSKRVQNIDLVYDHDRRSIIKVAVPGMLPELISMIGSYLNYSCYGPEAWRIWDVDVLDEVPKAPGCNLSNRILLYIPLKISMHGKEQTLTLKVLKEMGNGYFTEFSEKIEQQFGDCVAPGWVFLDREVIAGSQGRGEATQTTIVEERGCSMQKTIEAVALNLMVFAFTGERLYGQAPWWSSSARCIEKVDGRDPVIVGFGPGGLNVRSTPFGGHNFGVACAVRNFSKKSAVTHFDVAREKLPNLWITAILDDYFKLRA